MPNTYVGFDPGAPYYAAMVTETGRLIRLSRSSDAGYPRPGTKKQRWYNDPVFGAELFRKWDKAAKNPIIMAVEQVSSREGEDRISSDMFVGSMWLGRGMAASLGWTIKSTAPISWKTDLGLTFKPGTADGTQKQQSLDMAKKLWPDWSIYFSKTKDHNKAEAALIAEWARRKFGDGSARS